ncbi:hypothetical protein HON22_00390 [Candidatus Peregrinibacteria bacterium]|jgi:hypothetical protein|nr:hypothetical protein [Candidatus Peregrinibacteria bacterium]
MINIKEFNYDGSYPRDYEQDGILFRNSILLSSGHGDVLDALEEPDTMIHKTEEVEVFDAGVLTYILAYSSEALRKANIQWFLNTKKREENTFDIPQYSGEFEYNGKFCVMVLNAHNFQKNGVTNNALYHNILVNPQALEESQENIDEISEDTHRRVAGGSL